MSSGRGPSDGTPRERSAIVFREFRGNLLFTRGRRQEPRPSVYEKHPTF